MAGFTALKAAGLPACDVNNYVEPPLFDGFKPIHMIVTTSDRFATCYQEQVSLYVACWLNCVLTLCIACVATTRQTDRRVAEARLV